MGAQAQELDLAVREPLRDQPAMKPIEPRVGERSRLAPLAPAHRVERDELAVDLERVRRRPCALELAWPGAPAGAPELRSRVRAQQAQVVARGASARKIDKRRRDLLSDVDLMLA